MKQEEMVTSTSVKEEAIVLAKESGRYAKDRVANNPSYIKKGVQYELETGDELIKQLKRELPQKWRKFLTITADYLIHDRDKKKRPTFDRIDPDGDYALYNLDILSFEDNTRKDKAIPVNVLDLKGKEYVQYPSMRAASKALDCTRESIGRYCHSGVKYLDNYLIQAVGDKKGQNKAKREKLHYSIVKGKAKLEFYDNNEVHVIHERTEEMYIKIQYPEIYAFKKS
ncbi:NUMOD1 domain-containing DNA-binding protein [Halobacillus faecis]